MKSRYIIDTSFISYLLIEDDVNHQKALDLYKSLPKDLQFFTPVTVLLELFIGIKKLKKSKLENVYRFIDLLSIQTIYIDDYFLKSYKNLLEKIDMNLTAIDLTLIVTAKMIGGKVLTFDKKLQKYC